MPMNLFRRHAVHSPRREAQNRREGPVQVRAATPGGEPVVSLKGVWVSLGGQTVLEDLHLAIQSGSFSAIIGPNGAGKTTLLRLLMGLLRPDRGDVRIFGKPVHRLGLAKHWIGYVPQRSDFNRWFPVSVFDVVMMGRCACRGLWGRPTREDREAVEQSLKSVGLWELRDRPIGQLSGGQQQRVFLARGLCGHTRLLLLDEPNAGLDIPSQQEFYNLLKRLQVSLGITVIVVSHDLAVISHYADELICINRTLHVHGTPREVLASPQLQSAYQCGFEWLTRGGPGLLPLGGTPVNQVPGHPGVPAAQGCTPSQAAREEETVHA